MSSSSDNFQPTAMDHNYEFLRHYIYPNIRRHEFDSWYYRIFVPNFILQVGDKNSHRDENQFIHKQIGGGDYVYSRYIGKLKNQREYHVRIRHLDLRNVKGEQSGQIYLMSPIDDNQEHRCVYAKILKSCPNVVELKDLILSYNCTDLHKTPPQIGKIYVEIMTQFLIEHQQELGIDTIELIDNAHYRCPNNRQLSIQLEKSRQLEGDDPYYMQFGYRPKYQKSSRKLWYNKNKMSQILTKDDYGLKQLCQIYECGQKIIDYIDTHQEQFLSQTLKFISRQNCEMYYQIYPHMFKKCGLKELESPIYVIGGHTK